MPSPLSRDLRERIVSSRERGSSYAKTAKELQVNKSSVVRIMQLYEETGSVSPRPLNNGRKPRLDEGTLQKIRERIERQPDVALQELIDEYKLPVSVPALCKTVNGKLGLRRKKNGTRGRAESRRCESEARVMGELPTRDRPCQIGIPG